METWRHDDLDRPDQTLEEEAGRTRAFRPGICLPPSVMEPEFLAERHAWRVNANEELTSCHHALKFLGDVWRIG